MSKQVKFKSEELKDKDKIQVGLNTVCRALRTTIGPNGKNAFIDDPMQPKITNDGKTIATSIVLEDKLENMGAWLVKNACSQTDDDAGDGTTTTSVLLKAIIDEALKRPESAMEVKKELQETGDKVIAYIKEMSKPIKDSQIADVAGISAESKEIGALIAEVIKKVGRKVPIKVEDNAEPKIDYEVSDGLETNVGFAHHGFINNTRNGTAEMENVHVFATDRRISTLGDITVLLTTLQANKITDLVILAGGDIDNSVLGILLNSKQMGTLNTLVIRARNAELEDMTAMSGARLIGELSGLKFADFKLEHLGKVKKITAGEKKTTIINDSPMAKAQVEMLTNLANNSKNQYEQKFLTERADKLSGGVAVIKVGANTDSERNYQKYKIEDAVNATKSALEEGLVEGGGMCFYRIANKFKGKSIGEDILRVALKEPLRAIIENCGEDYTAIIKRLPNKKGYNASNGHAVDMFKEGIVDSAMVTRCAFKNALETAANFITAEVAIAENNEKQNDSTIRQ